jgi:hypothetical protein
VLHSKKRHLYVEENGDLDHLESASSLSPPPSKRANSPIIDPVKPSVVITDKPAAAALSPRVFKFKVRPDIVLEKQVDLVSKMKDSNSPLPLFPKSQSEMSQFLFQKSNKFANQIDSSNMQAKEKENLFNQK